MRAEVKEKDAAAAQQYPVKPIRLMGAAFVLSIGYALAQAFADEGAQVACLAENTGGRYLQAVFLQVDARSR
ncbi:MAG: SDR family oxidoreductase [Brachymonas sp.]|nr:SDR family oxidoreductase [Brachymonas sp.]